MNDEINKATDEQLADEPKIEEEVTPYVTTPHYAGFWMRFWAYLLDLIVIGSISRLIIYPVLRALEMDVHSNQMFSPVNIATAAVFYLYFILFTKYSGQTIGKMVLGLKVISLIEPRLSWQTVLVRELFGRYITATIFILYVLIAFLAKKQGVHDLLADTTVIHENSLAIEKTPVYS
ncbi:RDD family protein [Bacillus sp. REN10]|uniref:RDD family protein n=1 Tax=Bacillus sp. REN10 TaxID=2782541 RepID=UPI00193B1662|nr:RDD family protein [Bacillus sp. REN10]